MPYAKNSNHTLEIKKEDNMNLKNNVTYKIIVNINNVYLTYICKVIDENEFFITFIDKKGEYHQYNKMNVVSVEEAKDGV